MIAWGLLACSSTVEGSGHPPPAVGSGHGSCVARKGTYIATYAVRSGNCGDIPERIEQVDQTAPPRDAGAEAGPSPCSADVTDSVDNCEVTYTSRCHSDGLEKGGSLVVSGLSKWTTDGTLGTAVEGWTAIGAAGNTLCTGTYDLTIRRE